MVNRHIGGTRFVNKSVQRTLENCFANDSSEVKKRKRNEEWEIVETDGEKRSPDYILEERRNYRKRIKYFERLIVREESENRKITKRNWIGNDSCTKRTSSKIHRRSLFLSYIPSTTCASFVSFLSRCRVFSTRGLDIYIYIYTVDARTSSRLNEERRKGRKKGGNEDEEGSLSKKLTVYKKYAKESFCVATKRTVRVVIARDTEEAERRGRFSFRQRITQFRGSNWVVCVFEISLFSALRALYLKEKEKPIDIPNSFCLSIRLISFISCHFIRIFRVRCPSISGNFTRHSSLIDRYRYTRSSQ